MNSNRDAEWWILLLGMVLLFGGTILMLMLYFGK